MQRSLAGGDAQISLTAIRRIDEATVRLDLSLVSMSPAIRVAFDRAETFVTDDAGRRYPVSASTDARAFAPSTLATPQRLPLAVDVAIPASATGRFAFTIAPAVDDREGVRFAPLAFRLPDR